MWTIEINYKTGDSFGSREETDQVGHAWYKLDKAKESLQMMKEHHNKPAGYDELFCPIVTDDGMPCTIHAFWHGYFETLISAKIVHLDGQSDDMSFEC